jgi:hypothetical protein
MIGGDISNETPPRLIVTIDVVAKSELEEGKGFLNRSLQRVKIVPNNLALSHLWNVSDKFGLSVELAAFESELWTQKDLDAFMDRLDRRGANPFNYAELYNDIEDFVADMPYRPNLKGVVDLPERVMRYGSYGIELQNI